MKSVVSASVRNNDHFTDIMCRAWDHAIAITAVPFHISHQYTLKFKFLYGIWNWWLTAIAYSIRTKVVVFFNLRKKLIILPQQALYSTIYCTVRVFRLVDFKPYLKYINRTEYTAKKAINWEWSDGIPWLEFGKTCPAQSLGCAKVCFTIILTSSFTNIPAQNVICNKATFPKVRIFSYHTWFHLFHATVLTFR